MMQLSSSTGTDAFNGALGGSLVISPNDEEAIFGGSGNQTMEVQRQLLTVDADALLRGAATGARRCSTPGEERHELLLDDSSPPSLTERPVAPNGVSSCLSSGAAPSSTNHDHPEASEDTSKGSTEPHLGVRPSGPTHAAAAPHEEEAWAPDDHFTLQKLVIDVKDEDMEDAMLMGHQDPNNKTEGTTLPTADAGASLADEPSHECHVHKKTRKERFLTLVDSTAGLWACRDDAVCKAASSESKRERRRNHAAQNSQSQISVQSVGNNVSSRAAAASGASPGSGAASSSNPANQALFVCSQHKKVRSARNLAYVNGQWICLPTSQCQMPGLNGISSNHPLTPSNSTSLPPPQYHHVPGQQQQQPLPLSPHAVVYPSNAPQTQTLHAGGGAPLQVMQVMPQSHPYGALSNSNNNNSSSHMSVGGASSMMAVSVGNHSLGGGRPAYQPSGISLSMPQPHQAQQAVLIGGHVHMQQPLMQQQLHVPPQQAFFHPYAPQQQQPPPPSPPHQPQQQPQHIFYATSSTSLPNPSPLMQQVPQGTTSTGQQQQQQQQPMVVYIQQQQPQVTPSGQPMGGVSPSQVQQPPVLAEQPTHQVGVVEAPTGTFAVTGHAFSQQQQQHVLPTGSTSPQPPGGSFVVNPTTGQVFYFVPQQQQQQQQQLPSPHPQGAQQQMPAIGGNYAPAAWYSP